MSKNGVALGGVLVGQPKPLAGDGRLSAIFKQAVEAMLSLTPDGLSGDAQADLRVHGGPERALCHYPAEHSPDWAEQFPANANAFQAGAFGENLSTYGLIEAEVHIGDIFRLGTARIQVSQPRMPCWKLGHRFGIDELPRAVAESGRTGWLYRVVEAGEFRVGSELVLETQDPAGVSIADIWQLHHEARPLQARLAALAEHPALAQVWRRRFQQRLDWLRRS